MHIRHINSMDDALKAAAVHYLSRQDAYREIMPADFLKQQTLEHYEQKWHKFAKDALDGQFVVLIAEDNNRFVGVSACGPTKDEDLDKKSCTELYVIYLLPECKGLGVGKKLFEQSLQEMRMQNFSTFVVWVFENNLSARGFYKSRGLTADGASRIHPSGINTIRLSMPIVA